MPHKRKQKDPFEAMFNMPSFDTPKKKRSTVDSTIQDGEKMMMGMATMGLAAGMTVAMLNLFSHR